MSVRLRAGTARCDITPPVGVAHANWGAQVHERAEGVDLPLWCTALALSDGETEALIVEMDLLQLPTARVDGIRQAVSEMTGVPIEHVRVSFSHTHSGPTLGPTWIEGGAELVPAYVEGLTGKIAGTAWEAHRRMQPVRAAAGAGRSEINVNRRERTAEGRVVVGYNPAGFVDRTVRVVRLDDLEGNPVAVVTHYACHPTILAHLNRLITPDYPGAVRRVVERTLGGTCLFLQGATGNIGPVEGYTGDPAVYHRLGMALGLEAARVAVGLQTRPVERRFSYVQESGAPLAIYEEVPVEEPDVRLRVASRTVRLPAGSCRPLAELEAEEKRLREALAGVRASGTEAEVREATMTAKRAAQQAHRGRMIGGRPHVEVEAQAICFGEIAMVGVPGEPFGEIGEAIQEASPFAHTMFSGYTNGVTSYIPTAKAFEEGGYEVGVSLCAPEAAAVLVEAVGGLLREMGEGD